MLEIYVPPRELINEETLEITYYDGETLKLEHSLISLSKWESKYHIPYLSETLEMSLSQVIDYVKFMTLNKKPVNQLTYKLLTQQNFDDIRDYISNPMTATTFVNDNKMKTKEIITAEVIYYWMIQYNIPQEYQKWHLNKLMALIKVCGIKMSPEKKMSRQEVVAQQSALNAARRAKYHTKG